MSNHYAVYLKLIQCCLSTKSQENWEGKIAVYNISSWESLEYVFWEAQWLEKLRQKAKPQFGGQVRAFDDHFA